MHEPDPPEGEPPDDRLSAILREAVRRPGGAPAEPDAPPDDDPIDDGRLRAWRAGALRADDAAALEALLAADPEARALAAASAEPAPEALMRWAEDQGPRGARSTPRWIPVLLAAAVLVAAGAALLMRGGQTPAYVTSPLSGEAATLRGAEAPEGTPIFRPGGVLAVTLRPEVAGVAPAVSAYVARPDGPLKAVEVDVETPEGGAIVVRAPASRLFGAEYGPWRLHIALGDADDAAGEPLAQARGGDAAWFTWPLVFEPVPDDGGSP